MKAEELKANRIETVNAIIAEIAHRGRKFLGYEGKPFNMFMRGNKVFIHNTWNGKDCCLSVPKYRRIKDFHHGGTMQGLVLDFKEYILTGKPVNGSNGYGGLYCPHWGYPVDDMNEIRRVALALGYLRNNPD